MKILAFVCKILAAIIWLGAAALEVGFDVAEMHATTPPRDAQHDWGTPTYFHRMYLDMFMVLVVALLAVVPNRWLVFSRLAFGAAVAIALLPFCVVLIHDWTSDPFMSVRNYLDPGAWMFAAFIFGPLPVALALSFWRRQKGADVTYA